MISNSEVKQSTKARYHFYLDVISFAIGSCTGICIYQNYCKFSIVPRIASTFLYFFSTYYYLYDRVLLQTDKKDSLEKHIRCTGIYAGSAAPVLMHSMIYKAILPKLTPEFITTGLTLSSSYITSHLLIESSLAYGKLYSGEEKIKDFLAANLLVSCSMIANHYISFYVLGAKITKFSTSIARLINCSEAIMLQTIEMGGQIGLYQSASCFFPCLAALNRYTTRIKELEVAEELNTKAQDKIIER